MKRKLGVLLVGGGAVVVVLGGVILVAIGQPQSASLPDEVIPIALDESTAFLIPSDNGYLLFDTGYPWDYQTFTAAAANHGVSLSAIRYVFISHAHDDHAGFLRQLVTAHPRVQVIAHERTATLLTRGENNKQNGGGLFSRTVYLAFRVKQWLKPRWTLAYPPYEMRDSDIVLSEDEVDLSDTVGAPVTAIHTPGHTSDSVSLLYGGTHLFCGDLASTSFNWIGGKYLTVFNENMEALYTSWSEILAREIPITVPSHGSPFPTRELGDHLGAVTQQDLVRFF